MVYILVISLQKENRCRILSGSIMAVTTHSLKGEFIMLQIAPELFDEVLFAYDLGKGTITHTPYCEGHINNTNLVTVTGKDTHRYILQRINTDIFTDSSALMESRFCQPPNP